MSYDNLSWLTGGRRMHRAVEALNWADPDAAQIPLTQAAPAAETEEFFSDTGDIRFMTDPALIGDRIRYEKEAAARAAAEEQVAIDVSALLCQPAENGAGTDLAGLYLHLESVRATEPATV